MTVHWHACRNRQEQLMKQLCKPVQRSAHRSATLLLSGKSCDCAWQDKTQFHIFGFYFSCPLECSRVYLLSYTHWTECNCASSPGLGAVDRLCKQLILLRSLPSQSLLFEGKCGEKKQVISVSNLSLPDTFFCLTITLLSKCRKAYSLAIPSSPISALQERKKEKKKPQVRHRIMHIDYNGDTRMLRKS